MDSKIVRIYRESNGGNFRYTIYYKDCDDVSAVTLPEGLWNKSVIVNSLIRQKFSQDHVEAIVNNHFLNIGGWLDARLAGSTDKFVDIEYDELQEWRQVCKQIAVDALIQYPEETL